MIDKHISAVFVGVLVALLISTICLGKEKQTNQCTIKFVQGRETHIVIGHIDD